MAGSAAPPISEAPAAMLRHGGPIFRRNGQIKRIAAKKPGNWVNQYAIGNEQPFLEEAAKQGWDPSDSGVRYHGIDVLYGFGFPDDEILLIARVIFPQSQKSRDTVHWWAGEVKRCLYGPKGAATRRPGIPRHASRGVVGFASSTHPPAEAPRRPGRPKVLDADYLLTWYAEEAGKRPLEGPRRLDADALGVSVPTIERLDAYLVKEGAIKIETLPKRAGRRVILLATAEWLDTGADGAIKNEPIEAPEEVPSELEVGGAIERTATPENGALAPQCIGEITGLPDTPPDAGEALPLSQPVSDPPGESPARWAERMRRREERYGVLRNAELVKRERLMAAAVPPAPPAPCLAQAPLRLVPAHLQDLADVLEAAARPLPVADPPPSQLGLDLASVAVPGSEGALARGDARDSAPPKAGPEASQASDAGALVERLRRLKNAA